MPLYLEYLETHTIYLSHFPSYIYNNIFDERWRKNDEQYKIETKKWDTVFLFIHTVMSYNLM